MPDLTQLQKDVSDRLRGLDALTEHLSRDEAHQFQAYLLGSLCGLVSQLEWEEAMGRAMEFSNTWLRTVQQVRDSSNDDEPSL